MHLFLSYSLFCDNVLSVLLKGYDSLHMFNTGKKYKGKLTKKRKEKRNPSSLLTLLSVGHIYTLEGDIAHCVKNGISLTFQNSFITRHSLKRK